MELDEILNLLGHDLDVDHLDEEFRFLLEPSNIFADQVQTGCGGLDLLSEQPRGQDDDD